MDLVIIDEGMSDGVFGPGEVAVQAAVTWLPDWRLDVTPETSSGLTGETPTLTAAVTDAVGDGLNGVEVDFELVAGGGDDDFGTPGNTPLDPDATCVTGGGGTGVAATCTVSYTEDQNEESDDFVMAWIETALDAPLPGEETLSLWLPARRVA